MSSNLTKRTIGYIKSPVDRYRALYVFVNHTPYAMFLGRSSMNPDDLIPVCRILVGKGNPHKKRVIKETPDQLHTNR